MIPRREQRPLDAITCVHPPHPRVPPGYSLLKVIFGGGNPQSVTWGDDALLETVFAELRQLLGITAKPLATRIYRWLDSFPQADVGHLERVDEIEKLLPPGIFLAGAPYRGLGVPDCIRQARQAAQQAAEYLNTIGETQ
jgi:oxygen-dependent protoporphyrinogen oxidase